MSCPAALPIAFRMLRILLTGSVDDLGSIPGAGMAVEGTKSRPGVVAMLCQDMSALAKPLSHCSGLCVLHLNVGVALLERCDAARSDHQPLRRRPNPVDFCKPSGFSLVVLEGWGSHPLSPAQVFLARPCLVAISSRVAMIPCHPSLEEACRAYGFV